MTQVPVVQEYSTGASTGTVVMQKRKQMGETQENGWTTMNNDNEEKKDDLLYEKDEELSEWKMKKSVAT